MKGGHNMKIIRDTAAYFFCIMVLGWGCAQSATAHATSEKKVCDNWGLHSKTHCKVNNNSVDIKEALSILRDIKQRLNELEQCPKQIHTHGLQRSTIPVE